MEKFEVISKDGKARIYAPYNATFVSRVKLLGGRWIAADRCWSVSEDALEDVRAAMRDIYGRDDHPVSDTADVILRFERDVEGDKTAVTILGRTVARAFGRDSGAKVGEGVLFLEGEPKSAGSVKNWLTVVPSGCVVKLLRVPASMLENPDLPRGVTLEVAAARVDRAALEDEKARLLKRLAEVEELLK